MSEWNYCPGCGTQLEREIEHAEGEAVETEQQTEEITDAAVEIARIEANRDVMIKKIDAGIAEHVAEVDTAAELAHAEGEAEGMERVIEAASPPETPDAPVVVVPDNPPPEEPEITPPPAEDSTEPSEHHEHRSSSYGNPGWFG